MQGEWLLEGDGCMEYYNPEIEHIQGSGAKGCWLVLVGGIMRRRWLNKMTQEVILQPSVAAVPCQLEFWT